MKKIKIKINLSFHYFKKCERRDSSIVIEDKQEWTIEYIKSSDQYRPSDMIGSQVMNRKQERTPLWCEFDWCCCWKVVLIMTYICIIVGDDNDSDSRVCVRNVMSWIYPTIDPNIKHISQNRLIKKCNLVTFVPYCTIVKFAFIPFFLYNVKKKPYVYMYETNTHIVFLCNKQPHRFKYNIFF